MSGDEEILCRGHDLYKHLVVEGYEDFQTFNSHIKGTLANGEIQDSVGIYNAVSGSKRFRDDQSVVLPNLIPMSSHEYEMMMVILNSKLLFIEDVEIIELILSNTYSASTGKTDYLFLSGVIGATLVGLSSAMLCKKEIISYFPLSLAALCSVCSVYSIRKFYKHCKESNEIRVLVCHIKTLQELCTNTHKMFRFLKETEILSTGQVSSCNIGAAMYLITGSTLKELDKLPTWKTLPHLRKCLVGSLEDALSILSCVFENVRLISPSWLDIKGHMSSSKMLLEETFKSVQNLKGLEGCISINDIQLLIDTYLVLQSEYLRWVALCFCPASSQNPVVVQNCKNELFKLLKDAEPKIIDINFKLNMNFNIQHLFSTRKHSEETALKHHSKELNIMQVGIHTILLRILSIMVQIRSLEDHLDIIVKHDEECDIRSLKENLTQQLSIVRDDLTSTIKDFDEMYIQFVVKKKSEYSNLIGTSANYIIQPEPTPTQITAGGKSCFNVCSPDEVFVALSGLNIDKPKTDTDDWCLERKPQIPKSLLTELSTTLKPIKKGFKEREKLALKRLGLQDIDDKLESESDEGSETFDLTLQKRHIRSSRAKRSECLSKETNSDSSDDDRQCMKSLRLPFKSVHTEHKPSEMQLRPSENEKIVTDVGAQPSQILSDSSLAKIIALKSRSWGTTEEECYSDG